MKLIIDESESERPRQGPAVPVPGDALAVDGLELLLIGEPGLRRGGRGHAREEGDEDARRR
jgi:hypothetical protein